MASVHLVLEAGKHMVLFENQLSNIYNMRKIALLSVLVFITLAASAKKGAGIYYFEYNLGTTTLDNVEGIEVIMQTYSHEREVFSGAKARNFYIEYKVKNKSTKVVYVDLGNSFFIRNEEPLCYYVPSSTTITNGQVVGGVVNVGAIAGAVGVGGRIGSALGGVNVGGANTSSQSSTVYSQRVLAIPPLSSVTMTRVPMFDHGSNAYTNIFYVKSYNKRGISSSAGDVFAFVHKSNYGIGGMDEGMINNYTENDSPINFTLYLSYSFNEDLTDIKQGYAKFYVSKIIAAKRYFKGMLSGKEISTKFMDELYPGWNMKSFFLVEKNR